MEDECNYVQLFPIEMGVSKTFLPRTMIFLSSASHIAGMTDTYHHAQLLVEMGSQGLFVQADRKPESFQSQPPK
jgi:hypothetical protein